MSQLVIPVQKKQILNILNIIKPLTNQAVIRIKDSNIFTVCNTEDNTVILYINHKLENVDGIDLRINIPDVRKLYTGIGFIGDINVKFIIDSNKLVCEGEDGSGDVSFINYFLSDDSVMKDHTIDINKISRLQYDTTFVISFNQLKAIMQAQTFASDAAKVYLIEKDGKILGNINNHSLTNINNATITVAQQYEGEKIKKGLPLDGQLFRLLYTLKNDINVKLNNEYQVLIFSTSIEDINVKYISSALTK